MVCPLPPGSIARGRSVANTTRLHGVQVPSANPSSFAFLYNASHPRFAGFHGVPIMAGFFRQLLRADPHGEVSAHVRRGDLALHNLALRPSRVTRNTAPSRATITYTVDRDYWMVLIWDLSDSMTAEWNTIDHEDFPLTLGSSNIYVVNLCPLDHAHASAIDERLVHDPAYLGATEVDLGNPLQDRVLYAGLLGDFFVESKSITFRLDPTAETPPPQIHAWINDVPFLEIRVLNPAEYDDMAPSLCAEENVSPRGRLSEKRIKRRGMMTHRERVATALNTISPSRAGSDFEYDFQTELADDSLTAVIPEEKMVKYALNEAHPSGAAKARLFRELLGITAKDWRYLAAQLLSGLGTSEIEQVRSTEFGIQYRVDTPVLGLNGEVKTVRTGWVTVAGNPARLVTAYIAPEGEQVTASPAAPPVLPPGPLNEAMCEELYRLAVREGARAASQCTPTPIFIEGYGFVPEGNAGFAVVVVADARKGLARWLRRKGLGHPGNRSGQAIPSATDSQSLDRAVAFAFACRDTLVANGIHCYVESYLD
jgi:hypothetical protein